MDELRDLYQDLVLDHGKHPRNRRVLQPADLVAEGQNPLCGDELTLYLNHDSAGTVTAVSFVGKGCAIAMASASMLTEVLRGQSLVTATRLVAEMAALCAGRPASLSPLPEDDQTRLMALSGVRDYPVRVKCALLPWRTLEAALAQQTQPASTE